MYVLEMHLKVVQCCCGLMSPIISLLTADAQMRLSAAFHPAQSHLLLPDVRESHHFEAWTLRFVTDVTVVPLPPLLLLPACMCSSIHMGVCVCLMSCIDTLD
jgi:hypothetical protein